MPADLVFEGVVNYVSEDSGKALVATIDDLREPDMFVRLQSWDENTSHKRAKQFEGKRVRVTVHVIDVPHNSF